MSALWVHEVAERFWADAGGAPAGFPRDVGVAAGWALPVVPVGLPDLSIAAVNAWLAERGIEARLLIPNRPVRACMLVYEGNGVLFIDATDSDEERRFSLAHEVAHYLVEYVVPRDRARARLGDAILPVLNGRRAASREERIGAILAGVPLGVRLHLMERTPDGHLPGSDVSAAERQADDLALELLAPIDVVRARLPAGAPRADVDALLRSGFGLPAAPAAAYARHLAPDPPAGSLFRRLFSVS